MSRRFSIGHPWTRREWLAFAGSAAATVLGCRLGRPGGSRLFGASEPAAEAEAAPACVTRPQQIEGSHFIDAGLERSDIRVDPADGSIRPGAPLELAFQVSALDKKGCSALAGAVVDVWQCDALGVYSGVRDPGGAFDTRGRFFLRGYQRTDRNGLARFLTIYPGWYHGRTVHIHFKIRASLPSGRIEFTSQLYFDDALTDRVHAHAPYRARGKRTTTNDDDFIFRSGGEQLLLRLAEKSAGYAGKFEVGLRIE
ncbi:MAG TPA: intradiol ring-cleavage dioxygenase [candidate division Zixibacteria bacterium]|nr:intradiol ring-cleavage dioxygenase [candidate division Zixibacteria bacterium]